MNQTPKMLLPCCASVRPHPDSAAFHQRSVLSTPQLAGALPNERRWIGFERETGPTVYEKTALPATPPVGAKSKDAVPTFVAMIWFGLNVPAKEGPVVR